MNPELGGGERSKARVRKALLMGSGDASDAMDAEYERLCRRRVPRTTPLVSTILVPFPRSSGCFSWRSRAPNVFPACRCR